MGYMRRMHYFCNLFARNRAILKYFLFVLSPCSFRPCDVTEAFKAYNISMHRNDVENISLAGTNISHDTMFDFLLK